MRSKRQELRASRLYNGKLTPGSGNQWHTKGDVITDEEMIELKTTTKDIYPLDWRVLKEHLTNALLAGKMPVFEIEYAGNGVTVVVLDKEDYLALRERG